MGAVFSKRREGFGSFGRPVDEPLAFVGDDYLGVAFDECGHPVVEDVVVDDEDVAVGMVGGLAVEDLGFQTGMSPEFPLPIEFEGRRADDDRRAALGEQGQVGDGLIGLP